MSNRLLEKLETKLDEVIETIEILRLQVEELEEKNTLLSEENSTLKGRQVQWEQGLTTLLNKLDNVTPGSDKTESHSTEDFEAEENEAIYSV